MAEEKERIYVIPLKAKNYTNSKAADTAVRRVKNFLTRHMKVEEKDIWIDESLNRMLWSHGKYSMPNRVRVKAVKFEDGIVEASLPELEFKKSRREILREERERKAPVLRKEEMPEEEEGEGGADDYEVVPGPDGEVKLKKKKSKKKKESEEEKEDDDESEEKSGKKEKTEKTEKKEKKSSKKEKKSSKTKKKSEKEVSKDSKKSKDSSSKKEKKSDSKKDSGKKKD